MMKRFLACLLLTICAGLVTADNANIRSIMSDISERLFNLLPQVHDTTTDPEIFFAEINELEALLEAAGPHFDNQPQGTQVSYQVLLDQIRQAGTYTQSRNLMMATHLLSQSFEVCASCHMQDQRSRRELGVSQFHDLSEFTVAEYGYMTRDYESALISYRNLLAADDSAQYQRLTAMERMLSIHLEVRGDIPGALKDMTALRGQGNEMSTLKHWREALLRLNQQDARFSPLTPDTIDELQRFLEDEWEPIQSLLNQEEREVYWLLARHRLYGFLNSKAAKGHLPMLYYWLAVSDRSMYFQFYDAMSRGYLEQCIRGFPTDPYAAQCFDEYELLMIVSYSGSAGVNIPEPESKKLNELRRLLYTEQSDSQKIGPD